MRTPNRLWTFGVAAVMTALSAHFAGAQVRQPYQVLDQEPDNVYIQPTAPIPSQMTNQGGVHFSFETQYLSTYMYRGVDQSTAPMVNESALQFDGRLEFDLGKLPHPFIGVFSNIFNDDPVSRFEEVRPYAGLEWTVRPITLATGFNGYIFPDREGVDTQEVWARISADDSRFWHTDRPFLSPYVYAAYDFDKYMGFYLEAGIQHDFVVGDSGLVVTVRGDFAYVAHDRYYFKAIRPTTDTGFQHYDVGVIVRYSLSRLLSIPQRFGEWQVKGLLYYSGPIDGEIRADSRVWGGVGLDFRF